VVLNSDTKWFSTAPPSGSQQRHQVVLNSATTRMPEALKVVGVTFTTNSEEKSFGRRICKEYKLKMSKV